MPLTESRLRVSLGSSVDDLFRDITVIDAGHALDLVYNTNKEMLPQNAAKTFDYMTFSPPLD